MRSTIAYADDDAPEPREEIDPAELEAVIASTNGQVAHDDEIEFAPELLSVVGAHHTDYGNAQRIIARHGVTFATPSMETLGRLERPAVGQRRHRSSNPARRKRYAHSSPKANGIADDVKRDKLFKHAIQSEQASRIRAALELAQSEPGIPVLPDQLDADPLLLNVANGMIDSRPARCTRTIARI